MVVIINKRILYDKNFNTGYCKRTDAFIGIPFAASEIVASSSPTVSTSGNRSKTVSASTCRNVALLSDVLVISS